jgi:hypothetical protein
LPLTSAEKIFLGWIRRAYDTGGLCGSDLVESLGLAGISDNVYRAEVLLKESQALGWIRRGKFEPSLSQAYFGVGGSDSARGSETAYFWESTKHPDILNLLYWSCAHGNDS